MRVNLNINRPFLQSNNNATPKQSFNAVICKPETLGTIKNVVFDNDNKSFSFFLQYLKDLKARHLNHPTHDIYISYDSTIAPIKGITDTQPIISIHDKKGKLATYFIVPEESIQNSSEDIAFMMTLKSADNFTSNAPDSIKAMQKAIDEELLEYEEF